jgi:hypothetical protein
MRAGYRSFFTPEPRGRLFFRRRLFVGLVAPNIRRPRHNHEAGAEPNPNRNPTRDLEREKPCPEQSKDDEAYPPHETWFTALPGPLMGVVVNSWHRFPGQLQMEAQCTI